MVNLIHLLVSHKQTEDVGQAHPRIVEAVETMLKKGKWTVPGLSPSSSAFML